ncbi:MAG: pyruvate:ferredoxin (flavodoxin) oxidoreductase, partial [Cyanobacteria bacterium J06639_1]
YPVLEAIVPEGIVLLNSPFASEETWMRLPRSLQQIVLDRHLKVYAVNAHRVAREAGMGGRINTVMQTCFFALANVLPKEEAIAAIKRSIEKTYSRKGPEIVAMNVKAVDSALAHLHEIDVPDKLSDGESGSDMRSPIPDTAPAFVREVLGKMVAKCGDDLPVSALPADGTYPTGTAKWEKRNIAREIPEWDADVCVQCGKCVMVCPHAVICSKVYEPEWVDNAPDTFKLTDARDPDWQGKKFTLQVSPEDCTGCGVCVDVCPAKNKAQPSLKAINMKPQHPLRDAERENWNYFQQIPNPDRAQLHLTKIKHQQMQEPLFEFSGACAGCGETPYLKLATQLFGDRMVVANATGCSSIYGGNLPTTPWTQNAEGRGPAWSNSLFEDNAEFSLGLRVAIDKQAEYAAELLRYVADRSVKAGEYIKFLADEILTNPQKDEADIWAQRDRVSLLKQWLHSAISEVKTDAAPTLHAKLATLESLADYLVKKSVWAIGGDGWAYDIGYGGLDHVLASDRNINVLVLDTEVYSNTGGQMSKATPRAAVAKFASGGKSSAKKDLGLMAMTYGNVYVASVAMGARDEHTLKAFLEAEAYDGPSLIIAYSHCIAHGIDMSKGMRQQKAVVDSGRWLLYRYHPDRVNEGLNPLVLDSRTPKLPVAESMYAENRFKMLTRTQPQAAKRLLAIAQADVKARWELYQYLASRHLESTNGYGDSERDALRAAIRQHHA